MRGVRGGRHPRRVEGVPCDRAVDGLGHGRRGHREHRPAARRARRSASPWWPPSASSDQRDLAALGGALAVTALLRLPDLGAHGLCSLVAAAAVVPVLWSGYTHSPRRVRRQVRRIVDRRGPPPGPRRGDARRGDGGRRRRHRRRRGRGRAGADLVRDGEHEAATDRFVAADRDFDSASSALGGILTLPARAVPVLAQHVEALATASEEGGRLASAAADAASTAPYQELKASDGQVDLVQVERMQAPVADLDAALQQADEAVTAAQSPWLVRPVADGLADLDQEIGDIAPEAAIADDALQVAPGLLGADGPRSYLVLFTSPAESRFLGGFTASYGVLSAVDGKVDLVVDGKISDLAASSDHRERSIEGQDEFVTRYGRLSPQRYFQNLTASPDMATTSEVAASLFEQTTGTAVDGVIVVDPFGFAALLELTGPIEIPDRDSRSPRRTPPATCCSTSTSRSPTAPSARSGSRTWGGRPSTPSPRATCPAPAPSATCWAPSCARSG